MIVEVYRDHGISGGKGRESVPAGRVHRTREKDPAPPAIHERASS